jgi:hypothetical protein
MPPIQRRPRLLILRDKSLTPRAWAGASACFFALVVGAKFKSMSESLNRAKNRAAEHRRLLGREHG